MLGTTKATLVTTASALQNKIQRLSLIFNRLVSPVIAGVAMATQSLYVSATLALKADSDCTALCAVLPAKNAVSTCATHSVSSHRDALYNFNEIDFWFFAMTRCFMSRISLKRNLFFGKYATAHSHWLRRSLSLKHFVYAVY